MAKTHYQQGRGSCMEFLEGFDWGNFWDPDYPISDKEDDYDNKPVSPDAWADTDDDWNGDY